MTVYLTIPFQDQKISHSWRTTIQTDIEGGEKRSAIQTWPRIKLESKIQLVDRNEKSFINAHFFRSIDDFWSIPIVSDKTTLTSQAAAAQAILAIAETDYRHFYAGRELILVDPDDWESYEVGTIDSVDSSTQITLSGNLSSTWPAGTWVFPLYKCRIPYEETIDSNFFRYRQLSIPAEEEFESTRSFSYSLPSVDTGTYPTYNSLSLFLDKPMNPIQEDSRKPYKLLGDIGLKTPFTTYGDARQKFKRRFQYSTKKSIWDMLEFFDNHQGRYGSFYTPTWFDDIEITAAFAAVATTLTTAKIYLTEAEITDRHIYIKFPDNSYVCRQITARPSETSITIDSQIGTEVTAGGLPYVRVSFLPEVRFDIDEIMFDYIFMPGNIAQTELTFNSLQR
jgi:hypothetical protein